MPVPLLIAAKSYSLAAALLAALAATPMPRATNPAPAASTAVRKSLTASGYAALPLARQRWTGNYCVTLTVADRPLKMLVDTGAPGTVLHAPVAAALERATGVKAKLGFVVAHGPYRETVVPRYSLGGFEGSQLRVHAVDLNLICGKVVFGEFAIFDGILGLDVLSAHAAHFDLADETLYLRPAHARVLAPLAGHWAAEGEPASTLTIVGGSVSALGGSHVGFYHHIPQSSGDPAWLRFCDSAAGGRVAVGGLSVAYQPATDTVSVSMHSEPSRVTAGRVAVDSLVSGGALTHTWFKSGGASEPVPVRRYKRLGAAPSALPRADPGEVLARAGYTAGPFRAEPNGYWKTGVVADGTELKLVLDTKASHTTFDAAAVQRAKLFQNTGDPKNARDRRASATAMRYSLGGFTGGLLTGGVTDLRRSAPIDGVLGLDFFADHAAHLDAATGMMYLLPHNLAAREALAGKWVCTSIDSHDGPAPAEACAGVTLEFDRDRVRLRTNEVDRRYQFVTESRRDPPGLILYRHSTDGPSEEPTDGAYAVYQFKGDELLLSLNHTGENSNWADAPPGFASNADWTVLRLKRAAKPSDD